MDHCIVCKEPIPDRLDRNPRFHQDCYHLWRQVEPSEVGYAVLRFLKKHNSVPKYLQEELPYSRSAVQKACRKLKELQYIGKTDYHTYVITEAGLEKLKP